MSTLWDRRLWALLFVLSANMLIDSLEVSTVVVAMPSISSGLHVSAPESSWFMLSFALGFGASILPGRAAARRFGRRRIYLWALLLFAAASLASGLAPDAGVLDAARFVKGVCVALTAPTGLAIIIGAFPEGPSRQRAVSVYSMFGASGFSAGLLLSGALTSAGWRWVLLFGGPAALALFPVALRLVPADPPGPAPAASPGPGVRTAPSWRLLRSAAGAAALNGTYWGFLFLVTFALQSGAAWSPLRTGLALLPTSLPLALTALYSGSLARRFGPGRLVALGSLAAAAGYAWYLRSGPHPGYPTGLFPAELLVGLAFVLCFAALHLQATSGLPPPRQAAAAGVYQTSVQLGGAAVLGMTAALAALDGPRTALAALLAVAVAGALIGVFGLVAVAPEPQPLNR